MNARPKHASWLAGLRSQAPVRLALDLANP